MKTKQKSFLKIFLFVLLLVPFSFVLMGREAIAQDKKDYKLIEYKTDIAAGKDKEVKHLFEGERRKIAQLTTCVLKLNIQHEEKMNNINLKIKNGVMN